MTLSPAFRNFFSEQTKGLESENKADIAGVTSTEQYEGVQENSNLMTVHTMLTYSIVSILPNITVLIIEKLNFIPLLEYAQGFLGASKFLVLHFE